MKRSTSNTTSFTRPTRRDFLKSAGASCLGVCALSHEAMAQIDAAQPEQAQVVLRCAVMSDVHFNGDPNAAEVERFRRAVDFTYRFAQDQPYKNFDALVVVGDMSNHGVEQELTLFKKEMDAALHEGTRALLCMGNHEFYGGNQDFWRGVFGVEPNARYTVNGYQFIAISPEKGTMKDGDYLYALEWFEKEIEEADRLETDPNKPIFVFQHYPVSPTVYGGRGHDDWGLEDLFDTLQKYPRVINFSGHTHYPINDPRCAWQGCFSAFGTGTLSYICHGGEGGKYEKYPAGSNNFAQFYIMEVRADNSVKLMPYDLITNDFFDVVYYVHKPGDVKSYEYTDLRYSTSAKPVWPQDAYAKVLEVFDDGARCELKQALCHDVTHSYRFDLQAFDTRENAWKDDDQQYFWSQYFLRNQPETLQLTLSGLMPGTKYRAKIIPFNPFLRAGDKALEISFQTKPSIYGNIDHGADAPQPDVLNLYCQDGALVNLPQNDLAQQKKIEIVGAPEIIEEPRLNNTQVVRFNAQENFFKIPFTAEEYNTLRRATIGATFALDPDGKGVGAVFGNTEQRGVELSVNYDEKQLAFWAFINGRYHILRAPVTLGEYVTAYGVVDGRTATLYINGKVAAHEQARGALAHPTAPELQAFCLGCDIEAGGKGGYFMKGAIAKAQLFSWALSQKQIENLSK